jgi:hypothetical protein
MAGVVLIPPIHLSARAQEWIVGWLSNKVEFPKSYKTKPGRAACDASRLPDRNLACGVEDVRAIFTGQNKATRRRFGGIFADIHEAFDVIHPTCPACRVLVDAAIDGRLISFPLKPTPHQTGVPE